MLVLQESWEVEQVKCSSTDKAVSARITLSDTVTSTDSLLWTACWSTKWRLYINQPRFIHETNKVNLNILKNLLAAEYFIQTYLNLLWKV
jgi:hypothetical protein